MNRPELLSPAGDPEKLEMALRFGADAVYLAGQSFGLRAAAGNFSPEELERGIALAHSFGAKAYVTINTVPREHELSEIGEFGAYCGQIGADAAIVSDLGVFSLLREKAPNLALHVSTQAGVTNSASARLWHSLGASRVILARELSLSEIAAIRADIPPELELEVFVHGAMCVSFSGRCLLSDYLNGREGNRGQCAQPCRWSYALMQTESPGQYYDVEEHAEGSYILNSKDLCAAPLIGALIGAGVSSLKIEGRAKSAYYTGAVTRAYRMALDDALDGKPFDPAVLEELDKVSHRPYAPGFLQKTGEPLQYYGESRYSRDWEVCGIVQSWTDGRAEIVLKNPIRSGERLELVRPGMALIQVTAAGFAELGTDETGAVTETPSETASRNQKRYRMDLPESPRGSMLRRKR